MAFCFIWLFRFTILKRPNGSTSRASAAPWDVNQARPSRSDSPAINLWHILRTRDRMRRKASTRGISAWSFSQNHSGRNWPTGQKRRGCNFFNSRECDSRGQESSTTRFSFTTRLRIFSSSNITPMNQPSSASGTFVPSETRRILTDALKLRTDSPHNQERAAERLDGTGLGRDVLPVGPQMPAAEDSNV